MPVITSFTRTPALEPPPPETMQMIVASFAVL
jgi:hypothetical protein